MKNAAASWTRRAASGLVAAVLAGGALALAAAAPAAADTDDFEFESLHTEFDLTRDDDGAGVATVTETFVAVFPPAQNRGFIRAIPEGNLGAPLHPTVESVTDETGAERIWEVDSESGYLEVTAGDPDGDYVEGRQTYVFTYTLDNVGRAMENGLDEFYWDINGTEWLQPFGAVSASVTVDAALAPQLTGDVRCYIGPDGEECGIASDEQSDGAVRFETDPVPAAPEESASIAIGFEAGTFTPFDRSFAASPFGWAQAGAAIAGIIVLAAAVLIRRRRLRDEPGRPTIVAEYAPPAGVDAMTAASIRSKGGVAIPATILELAVGGVIRIIEPQSGGSGKPKLSAELVDPGRADGNGLRILTAMFGDDPSAGAVFPFGEADDGFAKKTHEAMTAVDKQAKKAYRLPVPSGRLTALVIAGFILGLTNIVFGAVAIDAFVYPLVPIILMVVGVGCLVGTLLLVLKRPFNAAGAEVRDHLKGLELFITVAEEDRIRTLQSPSGAERRRVDVNDPRAMLQLYERLLPYAVIFGKEKDWAGELATRYADEQPTWWAGSTAFNAAVLASNVSSLSSSVMTTTTSTASSSGGSTGGGFGGGGGGGGGGRGF